MTVTYTSQVTTCTNLSCFLKLLLRWRGSIYKIIWFELLIFLGLYYALSISYRFWFDQASKEIFEKLVTYCEKYGTYIPLSFVLGFYVSLVMTRWWNQYTSIPFPDNLAILVGASIKSQDERAKILRRTIVRYVCVTFTITLTMISPKVKKRFPTLTHFVEAGLITKDEKNIMENLDNEFPSYSKYWLPLAWASNIVTRGRHEGLIRDDVSVKTILEELNLFRSRCGSMLDYDWISIPLVYTQVVTLAVYSYFLVALFATQYLNSSTNHIDLYFPFLPVLEFFFYMGWLKVAETLINPYGNDDDDFEVVWMIDRHLQVSYLLVDKIHQQHPKLMRDPHWMETAPNTLPFTVASQDYMLEYPFPSTLNINLSKNDQNLIVPNIEGDSEVDGNRRKRSGSYLWRLYGKDFRKRRGKRFVELSKVVSLDRKESIEVNSYDDTVNQTIIQQNSKKETEQQCIEFENLKKSRQENRKKKLKQYLELLKHEKNYDIFVNIIDKITE